MPQTTDYIQSNSDSQSSNGYKTRLNKWAIARMLPDMTREVVARFRSRSDADGHMQLLLRRTPGETLMIVFDCPKEEAAV